MYLGTRENGLVHMPAGVEMGKYDGAHDERTKAQKIRKYVVTRRLPEWVVGDNTIEFGGVVLEKERNYDERRRDVMRWVVWGHALALFGMG
jgi:hypothetical protein